MNYMSGVCMLAVACCLDVGLGSILCGFLLQVPYLLMHHRMRYVLGYSTVLVIQVLNWQLFGLDGWLFQLLVTIIIFLPPEFCCTVLQRYGDMSAKQPKGHTCSTHDNCFEGLRTRQAVSIHVQMSDLESISTGGMGRLRVGFWGRYSREPAHGHPHPDVGLSRPRSRAGAAIGYAGQSHGQGWQSVTNPTDLTEPQAGNADSVNQNDGCVFDHGNESGQCLTKSQLLGGWCKRISQWMLLVVVASFAVYHVLTPLRHVVLYSSRPAWTEEGHIAPWHNKLHTKVGWLYIVAQEQHTGKVLDFVPHTDALITRHQLNAVMQQPYAMLQYCSRMQQLFDAAGRPLDQLKVISCFSLNGQRYKTLYDGTVNLLGYLGTYIWLTETAVSKWAHDWDTAPKCDQFASPEDRHGMVRRSRDAYEQLQSAAGLHHQVVYETYSSRHTRKVVCHNNPPAASAGAVQSSSAHLVCEQYAYTWNLTTAPVV